jgi:hypothetical protein
MWTMASLWEVLLHPQRTDTLPLAKEAAWKERRDSLHEALRRHNAHARIRSPRSLWSILHRDGMPSPVAWTALLGETTLAELVQAMGAAPRLVNPGIVTWSARWMADPRTNANIAKRNRIRRWLDRGRIVLLQETHCPENR